MPRGISVILFSVLLFGLGRSTLPAAERVGDAAKGKPIYEKNCLLCHGPQGRGDGPMGKSLSPPATDLASAESRHKSDAELLKAIREGHPDSAMTAWEGSLSEREFDDVLPYVRYLSRGLGREKS